MKISEESAMMKQIKADAIPNNSVRADLNNTNELSERNVPEQGSKRKRRGKKAKNFDQDA